MPRLSMPGIGSDVDHGYGNAINVMHTVDELETAGVAALSIEDIALPLSVPQMRDLIRAP